MRAIAALAVVATVGCGPSDGPRSEEQSADGESAVPEFVMPRDTDILLASVEGTPDALVIGMPVNVTQRPDYDNQPTFVPDGSGFWYTVNDPHDGQADIWRYDIAEGRVTRVTMTSPESEYSATPLPDGSGVSVIRVEADSAQRLWRLDHEGSDGAVIFPELAPVGYHAWSGDDTVVMFVLGTPATLRRGSVSTQRVETLAENIGRSIQQIPGSTDVSYVQLHDDGSSTIMRLPGDGSPAVEIAAGVDGGDYHAWTPDGILLQASGAIVYGRQPGPDAAWAPVADFSELNITLSRLAVSPDGRQIALVAEPAPVEGFGRN